ncbi:MAG: hypothetical protein ACNS62_09470 [Candidatus Cyclobacteriaceae bacterium M3_2C_046]
MRKKNLFILLLAALAMLATIPKKDLYQELLGQYRIYLQKFSNEKVYLHFDRNFYQPGEVIWFKAYLVNSFTNLPAAKSETLHLLIFDQDQKLISEKLYPIKSATVSGGLDLPEKLNEGIYQLVAYTNWMKNFEEDLVFREEFEVKLLNNPNLIVPDVFLKVKYEKDKYQPGDQVIARVSSSTDNKQLEALEYNYEVRAADLLVKKGKGMVLNKGESLIQFRIPPYNDSKYQIELTAKHKNEDIMLSSPVPIKKSDIHIQFFPEGGNYIAGLTNNMAFKATNDRGQPIDVQGKVLDQNDREIVSFSSVYEGMGYLYLHPRDEEPYKIEITDPPVGQTFRLPSPSRQGTNLHIRNYQDDTLKIVLQSTNKSNQKVSLYIQQNGNLIWAVTGILAQSAQVLIPTRHLPPGIAEISLFDRRHIPIAERLVFINKHKLANISLETDQKVYQPREKVELTITTTDYEGKPVPADLSLSVLDQELNLAKRSSDNIISYFWLHTELKGKIPTPGFYFNDNSKTTKQALDLVMLTHGWRKYHLEKIIETDYDTVPNPIYQEYSQGYLTYRNDKAVKNARINVMELGGRYFTQVYADEKGHFNLPYVFNPHSTNPYLLHATSPKGRDNVNLVLNRGGNDPFIRDIQDIFENSIHEEDQTIIRIKSDMYNRTRYAALQDLGKYKLLQEITIEAKKYEPKKEDKNALNYSGANTITKYREELMPAADIFGILSQVTSLFFAPQGEGRLVFGNRNIFNMNPLALSGRLFSNPLDPMEGNTVLFIVDDVPFGYDYRSINYLNIDDIEMITAVKYPNFMNYGGFPTREGMFFIKTNNQEPNKPKKDNFMVLNGYEISKEFYAPEYKEIDDLKMIQPDLRTTLYWDPNVKTNQEGKAKIVFYNSDRVTTISGIVEGISQPGYPGFSSFNYQVIP